MVVATPAPAGGGPGGGALGVVAPPAEVWSVNPLIGNFNPGTKTGQAIFEKKTKGLPAGSRFTATKKDAQAIRRFLQGKSATLGEVVTRIPVAFDGAGLPTSHANLLTEYSSISSDRLIREAHKRFSTGVDEGDELPAPPYKLKVLDPANVDADKTTFYARVNSQVNMELIKNILDDADYAKLILKQNAFTFHDDTTGIGLIDGPCLTKMLMDRVDPNVVVGVEVLRQQLENVKLHTFKNNVDDMLMNMEENYVKIVENHSTCESIRRYCLNALLSGPNAKFNSFIDRIKDDIDSQTGLNKDMTFDQICTAARAKFNNMEASNEYNKVDPKDATILALTTRLEVMEKSAHATTSTGRVGGGGGGGGTGGGTAGKGVTKSNPTGEWTGGIATWRTIKKGPTATAPDGTTVWWCPEHVHPQGLFNGTYGWHKPEDHATWKADLRARQGKKPASGGTGGTTNANLVLPGSEKLAISQRLKEVLCSRLCLSDEDAENYCNEVCQSKD